MKRRQQIFSLRDSRGSSEWYLNNFLANISRSARLMHKCIAIFRGDRDLFLEAVRNYVVALVSAVETFYRDLFIYLSERDSNFVYLALNEIKKKLPLSLETPGVTHAEIASITFNFQRLGDVDAALSVLLEDKNYFEALASYKYICAMGHRPLPGRMGMPDGWQDELKTLFEKRHEFIHDRNSKTDLTPEFMQRIESIVLALGQVSTAFFHEYFEGKTYEESRVMAFLTINDLIAEDWTTSPPSQSGEKE